MAGSLRRTRRSDPGRVRATTRRALRASRRAAAATARRLRRVAGEAVSASVATTDPAAGPLPARPRYRRIPAGGRRLAPGRGPACRSW